MGKAILDDSVGPFGASFARPWLCPASESSMTHASRTQVGRSEAGMRQRNQGTKRVVGPCNMVLLVSFPPKVLQRCLEHHFPNHRQGGK